MHFLCSALLCYNNEKESHCSWKDVHLSFHSDVKMGQVSTPGFMCYKKSFLHLVSGVLNGLSICISYHCLLFQSFLPLHPQSLNLSLWCFCGLEHYGVLSTDLTTSLVYLLWFFLSLCQAMLLNFPFLNTSSVLPASKRQWNLLVDPKGSSQLNHKLLFYFNSVFIFWPLECSIFSQLHTLMIQAILSATSLLLVQKSPLKLLWEPSSLNQMIVNFIIPNTSKHSSHSLNISVIFYNLFPHIDKKNLSELRSW